MTRRRIKPIPGFPGYYATDDGHVLSAQRGTWRELSQCDDGNGYAVVSLQDDGGRARAVGVHRLVALAFLGNPPFPRAHVCHGDRNKLNNRLDNLRYDTARGNSLDRWRHGTMPGLSVEQRAEVVTLSAAGLTQRAIASRLGSNPTTVGNIIRRVRRAASAIVPAVELRTIPAVS